MLTEERKLAYPGSRADRRVRRYVPPVRLVQADPGVENAGILIGKVAEQSFLHFNPEICVIPPGASVVLDYGIELHGGVRLVSGANNHAVTPVEISFGESVSEALGRPVNDHAVHIGMVDLPPMGMAEIGNTAFRFLRVSVPADAPHAVELMGAPAVALYLDLPYVGSFRCNDDRLNRIWEVGAYTVHLNMQDYIYDGVKRDRFVWMGDLYPEVRVIAAVFNDTELVEKSLDFMRDHTPPGMWMNTISSYTAWWVICQADWYRWRGNRHYLEQQREALKLQLEQLAAVVRPDGTEEMPETRFLDWPNAGNPDATTAGLQGLLAWSLASGAALMEWLDEPEAAARYRERAGWLTQAPAPVGRNKTAAAMQVLGGLRDAAAAEREVFAVDPTAGVSTFYGYFVLLARAQAGDVAGALEVIREYWGTMIDYGATTFWEDFDLAWVKNAGRIDEIPEPGKDDLHADFGNYCYKGLRHSFCHGWAGGPTAFLSEKVLGIRPLEPGFTRFAWAPDLAALEWAEGTVPTPHGVIRVRAGAGGAGELTVPAGTVAELPDGRTLGAGTHKIKLF